MVALATILATAPLATISFSAAKWLSLSKGAALQFEAILRQFAAAIASNLQLLSFTMFNEKLFK